MQAGKIKFFLLLLAYFSFLFSIYCQQNDSLLSIVNNPVYSCNGCPADTQRVNLLITVSENYWRNGNYEKGFIYARQAEILAENIRFPSENKRGWEKGMGAAFFNMGITCYYKGINPTAKKFYTKALNYQTPHTDFKGMARTLGCLGNLEQATGNLDLAMENYYKSLKISEEIKYLKGMGSSHNNLGNFFNFRKEYDKALLHFNTALNIYQDSTNQPERNKRNIATIYNNIALIYYDKKEYSKSLELQLKSLKLKEESGDISGIYYAHNNIGNLYDQMGDSAFRAGNNKVSLEYYKQALQTYHSILPTIYNSGDQDRLASVYINIGIANLRSLNPDSSRFYLKKALRLVEKTHNKDLLKICHRGLYETENYLGNYQQSLQHYRQFISYRDSLYNEETTKATLTREMNFQFEKKQSEEKLEQEKKDALAKMAMERQKMINYSAFAGLTVILIISVIIFRTLTITRKQKKIIESEKKLSDKLLLNILPAQTAEELKKNNCVEPKHFESVTVLFTDFKGFTQIAETLSAGELVKELDFIFKEFDRIISFYGKQDRASLKTPLVSLSRRGQGEEKNQFLEMPVSNSTRGNAVNGSIEKIKTIGDSYMCAGGLPLVNETHPYDVVRAAIEINEFMKCFTSGNFIAINGEKKQPLAPWQLRIGIHTGPVTAGVVGDAKFVYDIWGDTVNMASRMESSGAPGKINISHATYLLIKGKFNCVSRGEIQAKNKGMVKMYFVEGEIG